MKFPRRLTHRERVQRGCLAVGVLGAVSMLSWSGRPARAQPAPSAGAETTQPAKVVTHNDMPDGLKQIDAAPAAPILQDFLATEVPLLADADPKVQSEARRHLEHAVVAPGGAPATVVYGAAYARALGAQLMPLLKSPVLRTRLNAAIVLDHVASHLANPSSLAPAVTVAASDNTEAVALWGVKAAKWIIPGQLDLPPMVRDKALIPAILKAVRDNPQSSAIIDDAYDALMGPNVVGGGPANVPALPTRKAAAWPQVVGLLNVRVGIFKKVDTANLGPNGGPILPGDPDGEGAANGPLSFIAIQAWTPAKQDMPIKQASTRAIMDLLSELVRIAPDVPKKQASDEVDAISREDIVGVIDRAGSAIGVIMGKEHVTDPGNTAAGVTKINPDTPGSEMTARVSALSAALTAGGLLPPAAPAAAAHAVPAPAARPAAATGK